MNIKELQARREKLWADLKKLLAPVAVKEQKIRSEIKEIQKVLYAHEMTPVLANLRKKDAEGSLKPAEVQKLAMLEEVLG